MLAFGGAIGSFMNVVVYRCPRGRSIVHPGSQCPTCGHAIRAWDNVPVLAWLWLRGRCRDCQVAISVRYPIIEGVVALLFASLGWVEVLNAGGGVAVATIAPTFDEPWPLSWRCGLWAFHLLMLCTLLIAGLIRFDGLRVPRRVWYPAVVVGLAGPMIWPWLLPGVPRFGFSQASFMARTQHAMSTLFVVAVILILLWLARSRKRHLTSWVAQAIDSPLALFVVLSLFLGLSPGVMITTVSMVLSVAASRVHGRPLSGELFAVGVVWGWIAGWPWLCHTFPLLGPAASYSQVAWLACGGAVVIGLLALVDHAKNGVAR